MSNTRRPTEGQLGFVDGLRAICIAFVFIEHGTLPFREHLGSPYWQTFLANGRLGVTAFFVISGFLITTLLARELTVTGRIGQGQFFARRALRLYPVLYLYVGLVCLLNLAGVLANKSSELMAGGLFVWNYYGVFATRTPDEWYLGHLWSLAVEQQFYLFWPLGLVWLGLKRAGRLAVFVVVLMPFLRVSTYLLCPAQRGYIGMMFHTIADALMMGAILALSQPWLVKQCQRRRWIFALGATLTAGFAIFCSPWFRVWFHGGYDLSMGLSMDGLAAVLVLVYALSFPKNCLARILENPLLRHMGVISYSLYVWQQMFLGRSLFAAKFGMSLGVAAAILSAEVSYWILERPIRQYGRRLLAARQEARSGS